MRIYQYVHSQIFRMRGIGKFHVSKDFATFLCGSMFNKNIDLSDIDNMNFSKGICKHCIKIYKKKYKKDLNFEVIKLKLGIKI